MSLSNNTSIFLVTANIASCFDQPKEMLNPWLDEFFKSVQENKPQFIAIHCQEIGGKNYETSMENVANFLRNIKNRAKLMDYTRANIFIDEAFSSAEKFTALGNLYFIRSDVQDIQIWDFSEKKFVECDGVEEHVGLIEDVPTKQKSKFPQQFFPECKWSRKGFLRTRWCINGTQFDLVNIHLFHDASNFIAMEKFPSVYTLNRKRAMEHTLDRFHNDEFENVPLFMFGDFNFRVDTKSAVEHLTEGCSSNEAACPNGENKRFYRDKSNEVVLTVSKKYFEHRNHNSIFMEDRAKWLRPFDKELLQFSSRLYEYPIQFPPSYPFEEGVESQDGKLYMKTRCPSWCDRIILSSGAKELVEKNRSDVKYNIMGLETHMGDHKPVGLHLQLPIGAGIVQCCRYPHSCTNFVHATDSSCFIVGDWCRCQAYPICPGTPNSVCYLPPTRPNLACAEIVVDPVETLKPLSVTRQRQCVCSAEVSEVDNGKQPLVETLSVTIDTDDLLRNLLKINGEGESNLKRVHSDPIKVRTYVQKLKAKEKSSLMYTHSLDSNKRGAHRLRLRATSSRLISHHSSSSEEWFEEVPPSPTENRKSCFPSLQDNGHYANLQNGGSPASSRANFNVDFKNSYSDQDDSISAILRAPQVVKQQNSLSNLLITDKSKCQIDNKSQGATSDDSSLRADGVSSVVPCPCFDEDKHLDSLVYVLEDPTSNKYPSVGYEQKSTDRCCCVLS